MDATPALYLDWIHHSRLTQEAGKMNTSFFRGRLNHCIALVCLAIFSWLVIGGLQQLCYCVFSLSDNKLENNDKNIAMLQLEYGHTIFAHDICVRYTLYIN